MVRVIHLMRGQKKEKRKKEQVGEYIDYEEID